jgi:uncharacterized protein
LESGFNLLLLHFSGSVLMTQYPLATQMLLADFSAFHSAAVIRVLVFFGAWLGLWLPIAIPLALWLKWTPDQPIVPAQKLPLLASLYLLAPLVLWGMARLEKGSFANYGLLWELSTLRSLGIGLIAGALSLLGLFLIQAKLGWLTWQQPIPTHRLTIVRILALTLLLGLGVSLIEELVFRGFLLNQFQHDSAWTTGAWTAGAIVSMIFALLHLVWEGQENLPQLPGLWLMGLVLVTARWVDQGALGLAWGLHAGWVWTIASLEATQAIGYTGKVPLWLTGWGGKPIAGATGILALLITGLLLAAANLLGRPYDTLALSALSGFSTLA